MECEQHQQQKQPKNQFYEIKSNANSKRRRRCSKFIALTPFFPPFMCVCAVHGCAVTNSNRISYFIRGFWIINPFTKNPKVLKVQNDGTKTKKKSK